VEGLLGRFDPFVFKDVEGELAKIRQTSSIVKINPNAYRLKLPSHIKTSDVFNVKHLVPFIEDLSEEDANSRTNSLQPGEDDVD
jgi:hypothetical protein